MRALWEQLNEQKWAKSKDQDREYVLDAFHDLTMEDVPEETEECEEEEGHEDAAEQSEEYDSDEEEEDTHVKGASDDGCENSQLAVGFKHDRSFVVRGGKIGVFKHTKENGLEFSTTINKVQTPKGKLFEPKKVIPTSKSKGNPLISWLQVMLHEGDTSMVMQDGNNPHNLYKMDLEYGKVVDDWKIHDDIPVNVFAPEKVGWA
jgi:hypothetical protein